MSDPMQRVVARIVDALNNTQVIRRNRALAKFFSASEQVLISEELVTGALSGENAICGLAVCGRAVSGQGG